jgi:predicted solute-binding protein
VLVIGDPAREAVKGWKGEVLDLGTEWTRRTGLPFVFARWRGRTGLGAAGAKVLGDLLDLAADAGLPARAALAGQWAAEHGQEPREAVEYVQRFVRYRIGPREEEALERFLAIVRADDAAAGQSGAAAGPRR